jgi:hypothetical protein
MKPFNLVLTALAVFVGSSVPARADITYTVSMIGSGTFDGTSFSDADVDVFLTGDPAGVTQSGTVFFITGPLMVTVAGLGTDTYTAAGMVVDNQASNVHSLGVGFGGLDSPAFLGLFNSAFSTYALQGPLGPVTSSDLFGIGGSQATLGGLVSFSTSGPETFTAVETTPEPASWLLLGIGLAILPFLKRRAQSFLKSSAVL